MLRAGRLVFAPQPVQDLSLAPIVVDKVAHDVAFEVVDMHFVNLDDVRMPKPSRRLCLAQKALSSFTR